MGNRVFVDGSEGTTGLQIRERLDGRSDISLVLLPERTRKDPYERRQAAGQADAARSYVATTMDRFANPYLAHRLSDIAQNHAEKVRRRIAALIDWGDSLGVSAPQPRLRKVIAMTGAGA